jgi:hypothetical protein
MTAEAMWDLWLTAGRVLYAVAADDAHRYRPGGAIQTPGRGWVCVGARERTLDSVLDALLAGEFYASTGVLLKQLRRGPDDYLVVVDERATIEKEREGLLAPDISPDGAPGTRVEWVGPGGVVLDAVDGPAARFVLSAQHAYVRCRVSHTWPVESGFATCHAWTQPAFTDGRKAPLRGRR